MKKSLIALALVFALGVGSVNAYSLGTDRRSIAKPKATTWTEVIKNVIMDYAGKIKTGAGIYRYIA
ncbi:MAG: hypothetical protein Nk1A_5700 [Endomicrobiia bacterium]|nr:MAG: hypothetical protein Nk1A_5700 [Endomicrobiia bacterium]